MIDLGSPEQINELAGRDEIQTQIIRKAMAAKQAAQKNEQGAAAQRGDVDMPAAGRI